MTDWLNEVVSEWVMCWNWNEMFGQLPDKDLLDLSGLRWSKGLCTNYEKMSLLRPVALEAEYNPLLFLSLSFVGCTHSLIVASFCCSIIQNWQLNELSGLSNKAVDAIAAFAALFLSPSLPVSVPASLPVCPPVYPHICVRKYVVRVFAFALLPFSLNWHLF